MSTDPWSSYSVAVGALLKVLLYARRPIGLEYETSDEKPVEELNKPGGQEAQFKEELTEEVEGKAPTRYEDDLSRDVQECR